MSTSPGRRRGRASSGVDTPESAPPLEVGQCVWVHLGHSFHWWPAQFFGQDSLERQAKDKRAEARATKRPPRYGEGSTMYIPIETKQSCISNFWSWEMKLHKEESNPKLDKCWDLFKNHLLVAQNLWGPKTTENSIMVKPAHVSAALPSPS